MIYLLICYIQSYYDQTFAKKVATLGALAHCSQSQIQQWSCPLCQSLNLTQTHYFRDPILNVAGYTGIQQNTFYLILRGTQTDSSINWIQDLSYQMVQYPKCADCFVHAGFYTCFNQLRLLYMPILQGAILKNPNLELVVSGRSMGAAMSTFAVLDLLEKYNNRIKSYYNMGSPRLGNHDFISWASKQLPIYRVVHYNDIVPHLPFKKMGFFHLPRQIFYDQQMKVFKVCDYSGQDPTCSDSLPGSSIPDHLFYFIKGGCQ